MPENSFANAIKRAPAPPPATLDDKLEEVQQPARKPGRPKGSKKPADGSAAGQDAKQVSGRVDRQTAKRLKWIAVEHETTTQALMAEAIAWLFRKYEKSSVTTDRDSEDI